MSTTILTVAVGTPIPFESPVASRALAVPMTVTVIPGTGGSITVEYQTAINGTWIPADGDMAGTLLATISARLTTPVYALRFTAANVAGIVEIAQ